jgi:O-antigen/teichoic acid export membrane protein
MLKKTLNLIKKHSKTDETRKTFLLGMGSGISQLVTIASSLAITHFYTPEEVGQYSVIIILIALLSILYTLRIDSLILISRSRDESLRIYRAANKLAFFMSVTSFIIIVIVKLLAPSLFKPIFIYVPILAYIFAIYNADREICFKNGEFKTEASTNVIRSLFLLIFQILFSFIAPLAASLAIAKGFSDKIASLFISNKLNLGLFPKINAPLAPYREYKEEYLPLLKTRFLQNLSNNSIFLYWSYLFDLTSLGIFHFAFKVVQLPSLLIGDTIYRVFEESFTSKDLDHSEARRRSLKVITFVSICSVLIYLALLISIDFIVSNFFPPQWQASSAYIKIIGLTIMPVALSPVLISIFKIQKRSAIFTNIEIVESLVKNVSVVFVSFNGSPTNVILAYSIVSIIFGLIKIAIALK